MSINNMHKQLAKKLCNFTLDKESGACWSFARRAYRVKVQNIPKTFSSNGGGVLWEKIFYFFEIKFYHDNLLSKSFFDFRKRNKTLPKLKILFLFFFFPHNSSSSITTTKFIPTMMRNTISSYF